MAKKEAAPQAEGDKPEGETGEAAPKKGLLSKKMLMIAVPVLVLLLGGGGAGAYFMMKKDPAKEAKTDEIPVTPPQVAFSDLDNLLVNIQGADATPAYLKLSVSLEMDDEKEQAGLKVLMPRVKDEFQAYLRELRLEDLKGSEGVMRLKEELVRRANVAAAPYHVRDVLLKDMIVQ